MIKDRNYNPLKNDIHSKHRGTDKTLSVPFFVVIGRDLSRYRRQPSPPALHQRRKQKRTEGTDARNTKQGDMDIRQSTK